jgi:hypothetical protein
MKGARFSYGSQKEGVLATNNLEVSFSIIISLFLNPTSLGIAAALAHKKTFNQNIP